MFGRFLGSNFDIKYVCVVRCVENNWIGVSVIDEAKIKAARPDWMAAYI